MKKFTVRQGLLLISAFSATASSRSGQLPILPRLRHEDASRQSCLDLCKTIRCGSNDDKDEERYSRQIYTLGARAHALVRSATVFIDGPSKSGLVYECAKNLALSGIGHIAILTSNESHDSNYHNSQFDDLGRTYNRGARAELTISDDDHTNDVELLTEYLRRLNPSLRVSIISRDDLVPHGEGTGIVLCVDRPIETQLQLNRLSRRKNFPFVSVETAGVYGRTFCDFGDSFIIHDLDGETPLVVPLDHVEIIDEDACTVIIHCVDGERHDVSQGDQIQFQLRNGDLLEFECMVVKVQGPYQFTVQVRSNDRNLSDLVMKIDEEASSFSRVKLPKSVSFLPLEIALEKMKEDESLFSPCDLDKSSDINRRNSIFGCFQSLSKFVQQEKRLPTFQDERAFMHTISNSYDTFSTEWVDHCVLFTRCCAAKFTPCQAIFGAIAAQETLKAASGLYNPVQQFLLYDCEEVLAFSDESFSDHSIAANTGQAYILGEETDKKVKSRRIFVVGAGAIGCEILKNLSAMGVATGKRGCVVVTDMDTIERSNLSRQLLFRDSDIGKFKSIAAQQAIRRFNPSLTMQAHTSKVGGDDHGPFDSRFWSKGFDVILNALDNVEARLYMDRQCVANEKALVDAGTLGSKGNVQVVIPHQSESYGSSVDPPEPSIPVCTLKNFPYSIAHTIQWGRDLFDGLFSRRARQANEYMEAACSMDRDKFAEKLIRELGDDAALDVALELGEDLSEDFEDSNRNEFRRHCILWAANLAFKLFRESVEALLREHPADSLDQDGEPFWSGSRKLPKALFFVPSSDVDSLQEAINRNFIEFIRTCARLRMETYLPDAFSTGEDFVSEEEARNALLGTEPASALKDMRTRNGDKHTNICDLLRRVAPDRKKPLKVVEFEKDDESNDHVAFVAAASNLRAICYGIPPTDVMETRRVAGKIIPAMITTTAFVSAVSCIELIKIVKGLPLDLHRNAFINLALPFFAFTAPLPAEKMPGLHGKSYTLWDRIKIKESKKAASYGGITLRDFLKRLKSKVCEEPDSIDVTSVSYGEFMIYANFLHENDNEIMNKRLWDLIEESVTSSKDFGSEYSKGSRDDEAAPKMTADSEFFDLTVAVEDLETGQEIELPPVRVLRSLY